MARIPKDEHPRILQMVDSEHRKVAEVAAEYGCTPANIYALLSKMRREPSPAVEAVSTGKGAAKERRSAAVKEPHPQPAAPVVVAVASDLFALDLKTDDAPMPTAKAGRRRNGAVVDAPAAVDGETPDDGPTPRSAAPAPLEPLTAVPRPTSSVASRLSAPEPTKKGGGLGAALAKPGMALMMRTAEGDENLTPFRSLDDLLSAVKPILRAAARSADAVWFSIQPVDLASLDSDAA